MKVKIYRINKENPLPTQGNAGDAGYDVYASEDIIFNWPEETKLIPCGIIAQAPEGYHFKLCIRSSAAFKRGFKHPNAPGIIDHRYCGPEDEIKLMLESPGLTKARQLELRFPIIVKQGERLGQLLLEQNAEIEWEEQENRNFAGENRGGIGSTGE